jgi:ATP-dependent DNA helicase DinG
VGAAHPFFAPGGALSLAHPSYEHRPGQEEMALAVEHTLRAGGTLMVEAGTGTGKTLAYLVPALLSGRRVVVSTGTRNLQDQIYHRDLPFLGEKLGIPVSACLMKGRDNYLCRFRFEEFAHAPLFEVLEERKWIGELRTWSRRTTTGDRAEIPGIPDGLRMWRDVNARAETCTGKHCPEYEDCWLTVMRRRAEQSQILVVNHHLFFADLAVRSAFGAVLPEYDTVIFDEGHLLEEIATLYFGTQASSAQVEDLARDAEALAKKEGGSRKGGGGAAGLRQSAKEFFLPLLDRLEGAPGRIPFDPPDRGGADLSTQWSLLKESLEDVRRLASRDDTPGGAGERVSSRASEISDAFDFLLRRDNAGFVYGMEIRGKGSVLVQAAPIDVSGLLRGRLFENLHASVVTSATLAVEDEFDFFQKRLGLEGVDTLLVDSSFDHASQAVLYLPQGMPEPRERDFAKHAVQEIQDLLRITEGRAFLLFTSYAMMEKVRDAISRNRRWRLFVQGEGSKLALVEEFRTTESAVLLGTTSFWHGVDVPGEALSLVVIDKLPFDVPSDPLVAARIERIREEGGNPFAEYQIPLAVLELKQGLGRLLRSSADRGILAVLDPRITTKPYGKSFLSSLPPYRVVRDIEACRQFWKGGA